MNKTITQSFLAFALITSAPFTLCTETQQTPKPVYTSGAYYGTHLITGILSFIAAPACAAAGLGAAVTLENCCVANINGAETPVLSLIALTACVAAGLGVIYKTPQWTDKFFFNKRTSTKQNIINFFARLIFVPLLPLFGANILFGEYLSNNIDIQEDTPTL